MQKAVAESPYFSETERRAQVCALLERCREKLKQLRIEEQAVVAEIGKIENEEAKRRAEEKDKEKAAKWELFKAGKITAKLWTDPWDYDEATFLYASADHTNFAVKAWGLPDAVWITKDFEVIDQVGPYFMFEL